MLLAAIGWKVVPTIPLGPLDVSPHGLGIAVGYGLGGVLVARRAERLYGISKEHIWNMLMWAVLGVIVGSRLFYVAGHIGDYIDDPAAIARVWEGGVVFYGGAIGGVLAAVPYMRKHGFRFAEIMDVAAPGFPLGLIFGRLGDLVIGDHLGGPTSFFLAYRYEGGVGCDPVTCLPDRVLPIGAVVHQTALYDLISVLILFPLVLFLGRRARPDGSLMAITVIWYATARFLTDLVRTTDTYAGLHGTQWVSLALIAIGLATLMRRGGREAVAVATTNGPEIPAPAGDHQAPEPPEPSEGRPPAAPVGDEVEQTRAEEPGPEPGPSKAEGP